MSNTEHRQLEHAEHRPGAGKFPLCLLAHDMDVPMNIGSLFRLADALGVERLYLTGTSPVPPNKKIRKTSRACERHVAFSHEHDPLPILERLKAGGYTIISLELTSASIDLARLDITSMQRVCLILGAENTGVSRELLDASDLAVHIPMRGIGSSMNVATACAIAVYEITRQWQVLDKKG